MPSCIVFALVSMVFICLFSYCVANRIFYPYEIEWIEGEVVCHILRILEGKAIYAAPSTEFIAEIYPPLYYILSSIVSNGISHLFTIPRFISLIASFGIFYLIYRIPVREYGSRFLGFIAVSLFICFYNVNGTWYDLARVDMLFFFFLFASCYIASYYAHRPFALLFSATLLVMACYTKQPGVIYLPFIAFFLYKRNHRTGILYLVATSAVLVFVYVVLNRATDGWFGRYTLLNPIGHFSSEASALPEIHTVFMADIEKKLLSEMRYELFYKLPVFSTLLIAYVLKRCLSAGKHSSISLWEITAIPSAAAYFLTRPNIGSFQNDLMYITLWGSVLMCFFIAPYFLRRYSSHTADALCCSIILLLLSLQMVLVLYNPGECIPAKGSREAGNRFISSVKNMPGEVYIPSHAVYAVMAGKKMTLNSGAYWGYQVLTRDGYKPEDLLLKLRNKYFYAVIMDSVSYYYLLGQKNGFDTVNMLLSSNEYISSAIAENYKIDLRFDYTDDYVFRSVVGFQSRPEIIMVPRD